MTRQGALLARLDRLEREVASLRAVLAADGAQALDAGSPDQGALDSVAGDVPASALTRRRLMQRAALGVAAGAGLAAARALSEVRPIAAQGPTPMYVDTGNVGTGITGISSTSANTAFYVVNTAGGVALRADNQAIGGTSLFVEKSVDGRAILASNTASGNFWPAINGQSNGMNAAISGEHSGNKPGTKGYSNKGSGIVGESTTGRGGDFQGKKAQVRLRPSTSASHPASGARGDLFVDSNNRLWFCRNGSTWTRLA